MKSIKKLKIAAWNSNSLTLEKIMEIKNIIEDKRIDIMFILEAIVGSNTESIQRIRKLIKNFTIVYTKNGRNNSVMILIRRNLRKIKTKVVTEIEGCILTTMLIINNFKMAISGVYYSFQKEEEISNKLKSFIADIKDTRILIGDFNRTLTEKTRSSKTLTNKDKEFINLINEENVTILSKINEITYQKNEKTFSGIDHAFIVNIKKNIIHKETSYEKTTSDHKMIIIDIEIELENNGLTERRSIKKMIKILEKRDEKITDLKDWQEKYTKTREEKESGYTRKVSKELNMISKEIHKLSILLKNKKLSLEKITEYIKKRHQLRKELIIEYYKFKTKELNKFIERINQPSSKELFERLKVKKEKKPHLNKIKENDKVLEDKEAIIYIENYFKNQFKKEVNEDLDIDIKWGLENNENILEKLSEEELEDIILKAQERKAPGWDKMTIKDIRFLIKKKDKKIEKYKDQLLKLMIEDIKKGITPEIKEGEVNLIYKRNDPLEIKNYRGITLIPVLGRFMLKYINSKLMEFLVKNKVIEDNQLGFINNKSTTMARQLIQEKATQSLNKEIDLHLGTADIKAAFDKINHEILIKILEKANFPKDLTEFIKKYLDNIYVKVKYKDKYTNRLKYEVGSPQGSAISPSLYIIYTNNIDIKKSEKIQFADDTLLISNNKENLQLGYLELQKELNNRKLETQNEKAEYMIISKKYKKGKIKIGKDEINSQKEIKYLGTIIDRKFNYKKQIKNIISRIKYNSKIYISKYLIPKSIKILNEAFIHSIYTYDNLIGISNKKLMSEINIGISNNAKRSLNLSKRATKEILFAPKELGGLQFARAEQHFNFNFIKHTTIQLNSIHNELKKISRENMELEKEKNEIIKEEDEIYNCKNKWKKYLSILEKHKLDITEINDEYKISINNTKLSWGEIKNIIYQDHQYIYNINGIMKTSKLEIKSNNQLNIYTDGSMTVVMGKNICGIGIFSEKEEYVVSAEITDIKTINEAELLAIYLAIKNTKQDIIINTDSEIAYKGILKINRRNENIWILEEIDKLILNSKYKISIEKVKAHTGEKDGNYHADLLAKKKEKKMSIEEIIIKNRIMRSISTQDVILKYKVSEYSFNYWENNLLLHYEKKILLQGFSGCYLRKIGERWYHPSYCNHCKVEKELKHSIYECESLTEEIKNLETEISQILKFNIKIMYEDENNFNDEIYISPRGSISRKTIEKLKNLICENYKLIINDKEEKERLEMLTNFNIQMIQKIIAKYIKKIIYPKSEEYV